MARSPGSLLALAEHIDRERAREVLGEAWAGEGRELGILLGTAYPPLLPRHLWQRQAIDRIAREGWRVPRQRGDVVGRLLAATGDLSQGEQALINLRRAVWGEKARIALREVLPPSLGGAGIAVTAGELSDLAGAAFEVALSEAESATVARFGEPLRAGGGRSSLVVLGMGKLGGLELNAGSDVDVLFIIDTDDGADGVELHDYWTRVARRAAANLEQPAEDGLIWRVDLRLRPEGSRGPVVNSVAAAERYYETWGRLWERAALSRARPIAGDLALGELFEHDVILPFVYRRDVDPTIATAMAELTERARVELCDAPDRDLKLGPGGIREAEFFVQSLQLIWGGREPSLRVTSTFGALARLRSRGLVTDREARHIADAYQLLRRAEHRIQWMSGIQTHLMPSEPRELERLARSLGFADPHELEAALARARALVSELFASLAPEAPHPPPRYQLLLARVARHDPELPAACAELFGSSDVGLHLGAMMQRPDGLLGELTRERHPEFADQLIDALVASPDPEQAALYLRSFFHRFISPAPYITALAEDQRAMRRLAWVLGSSVFVGDALVGRPDLVDVVLLGAGAPSNARATVAAELAALEGPREEGGEPRDVFVAATRRAKRRVMVEVAVADLADGIGTREATRILSELADELLERAVAFELGGARGLAVVAVGKLGGMEIGYGSDLDVLFIYDPAAAPPERDPAEHFVRVAQRVIRLISEPHPAGPGYELDTRLRPSGAQGLLVTSLESFARYHGLSGAGELRADGPAVTSSGAAWERQALLRARLAAGDRELGARVLRVTEAAAYERGAPPPEELHRLRLRMEAELARERPGRHDLKTGHGGLLDIEFCTQWLQMRYGGDPRVRTPDTLQALEALGTLGYLPRRDFETLRDGYRFLRRLEQRIHVLHGAGSTTIDAGSPGLARLARRMGMPDTSGAPARDALLARYATTTRAIRESYLAVLGLTPPGDLEPREPSA
ncbi:MAG: bifunctional [glutamate--ammonia ligase]-adenylyl-L-tyrosine phosphorylase/[glutamate--ammonia-ligase] adenylyltransferase [Sorangiineae bacterium]|nr:bifunctional [glutamate--ammonia ligase]-adenylyl-L-tyrosine phosphorylase/[glutamate--ammonia-ligase] adenylyltransferase [Polyangiaceae bacterium]MEB2323555.1 bifunctional [glutamate--ammonia ligase]-adenylyl-L-tyrosine phosphorylase/[glutamate--ammonia-ligase] adenylyltransferase [Sorangiineae bacterium]